MMTAGISNRCSTEKNGPAGAEPFYPKFSPNLYWIVTAAAAEVEAV